MSELEELETSITTSMATIRAHWSALLDPPSSGGAGGSRSTLITADDHDASGADIDRSTRIVSLRREVVDVLNAISRWVMEERPVTTVLPDGTSALSMSLFVERHAEWIAMHDIDDGAYETKRLAQLASDVRQMAAPKKREWISLGSCPLRFEDEVCGGQIRAWPRADDRDGEVMAQCQKCGTDAVATWWESQMFDMAEVKMWLTDSDLVSFVHRTFGRVVKEATIRQWVKRAILVPSSHRDEHGRRLFHREAVIYALDRFDKRQEIG